MRIRKYLPQVFFQRIVDRRGKLYGVEILTRDWSGSPPVEGADLLCFFFSLLELDEGGVAEALRREGVKVHFNIFLDNASEVPLELFREYPNFVLEVVEKGRLEKFTLGYLKEKGVTLALDDFGRGQANFDILPYFDIVKVDRDVFDSRVLAEVIKTLKKAGKFVILEKARSGDQQRFHADAYQGYDFHRPEPIGILIEEFGRK